MILFADTWMLVRLIYGCTIISAFIITFTGYAATGFKSTNAGARHITLPMSSVLFLSLVFAMLWPIITAVVLIAVVFDSLDRTPEH